MGLQRRGFSVGDTEGERAGSVLVASRVLVCACSFVSSQEHVKGDRRWRCYRYFSVRGREGKEEKERKRKASRAKVVAHQSVVSAGDSGFGFIRVHCVNALKVHIMPNRCAMRCK